MVREREISESFRGLWCDYCLGHGLARCPAASCGSRQRTLRQVLEYSPQSTIRNSARRLCVFLVGTTGNAVGVPLPRAFSTTCFGLTIVGWTASRSCKYEHISCVLILHSAQLALSFDKIGGVSGMQIRTHFMCSYFAFRSTCTIFDFVIKVCEKYVAHHSFLGVGFVRCQCGSRRTGLEVVADDHGARLAEQHGAVGVSGP